MKDIRVNMAATSASDSAGAAGPSGRAGATTPAFAIVCGLLIAALIGLWVGGDRGWGLTDESYYAMWIIDPAAYNFSIQPFGILFNHLYEATGRSIAGSRRVLALATMLSGGVLGLFVHRYYRVGLGRDFGTPASLMVVSALAALLSYNGWILTPNYNLLTNIAAALLFAGVTGWMTHGAAEGEDRGWDLAASILIGVGGCLAFFGKPTFAGMAALAVAALLAPTAYHRKIGLALTRSAVVLLACVPLLALALLTVMSADEFVQTIRLGLVALDSGNSLFVLPFKTAREIATSPPILFVTATALVCALVSTAPEPTVGASDRRAVRWAAVLLAVAALFFLARALVGIRLGESPWPALGATAMSAVLAQLTLAHVRRGTRSVGIAAIAPVLLLVLLPFATAFGTTNDIVAQTSVSVFSIAVASAIVARLYYRPGWRAVHDVVLGGIIFLFLAFASLSPYGQSASVWSQNSPVRLPGSSEVVRVDAETAAYARGLRQAGARDGMTPDTPIIDLSGGGPGTAYFLGGRAPDFPWLTPNFKNAVPLADAVWSRLTDAERGRAWVVGPVDPRFAGARVVEDLKRRDLACIARLKMSFWNEVRVLSLWKAGPASGRQQCRLFEPGAITP